jgi:hypothetical protein
MESWQDLCKMIRRNPDDFDFNIELPGWEPEYYPRPYQGYCVYYMKTRMIHDLLVPGSTRTFGCILAGLMSLGKTLEVWLMIYLCFPYHQSRKTCRGSRQARLG